MDGRRFFLSYSRQELYFAQAVTHTLQAAGLNVWFDLQELEPGCDWKAEIASGLEGTTDLILIVSRASISSPWVEKEWQKAREVSRPIHLIVFEVVTFAPVTVEDGDGNLIAVDPTPLVTEAVSIIDARRDFKGTMQRLISALTTGSRPRDPIPAPNRYRLPEKMPAAVAFVAGSMGVLAALTLFITLTQFSVYIPMFLAGLMGVGGIFYQTWVFLRRESFLGTRVALIAGIFFMLFFIWPTIPLFIAAAWIVFRSPDIHRWSPLGQGLTHARLAQDKGKKEAAGKPGDGCVMLITPILALVLLEPLIIIPAFILMLVVARIRRPRGILRRTGTAGETVRQFRIHAVESDILISSAVIEAMESAGHRFVSGQNAPTPDFEILIATNETADYYLKRFKPAEGARTVVVVANNLDDPKRFNAFADYQWVDYRRHDSERLFAMANDLRATGGDSGNSYSTRTVPQDFRRLLVPRTVAMYMVVQFFYFNLFFVSSTRTLLDSKRLSLLDIVTLIFGLGATIYSVWLTNRIARREIHIERIVWLNILLSFGGAMLGFVIGLFTPLPAGMVRDTGSFPRFLLLMAIGLFISYRFGKFYLRLVLGDWLPVNSSHNTSGFPAFKRDAALWRRNGIAALISVLLTLGFLGKEMTIYTPRLTTQQTNYEAVQVGTLNLNVPTGWLMSAPNPDDTSLYTQNVPIAYILRQANGPFNQSVATLVNQVFRGGVSGGVLASLNQPIAAIFNRINFALMGDFVWDPEFYYGDARYSRIYAEGSSSTRQFVMTVWEFAPNSSRAVSSAWQADTVSTLASVIKRGASSTREMTFISESSRSLGEGHFLYEVMFSSTDTDGTIVTHQVALYQAPWQSYFITFSGGAAVLQAQADVIQTIITSGAVR